MLRSVYISVMKMLTDMTPRYAGKFTAEGLRREFRSFKCHCVSGRTAFSTSSRGRPHSSYSRVCSFHVPKVLPITVYGFNILFYRLLILYDLEQSDIAEDLASYIKLPRSMLLYPPPLRFVLLTSFHVPYQSTDGTIQC